MRDDGRRGHESRRGRADPERHEPLAQASRRAADAALRAATRPPGVELDDRRLDSLGDSRPQVARRRELRQVRRIDAQLSQIGEQRAARIAAERVQLDSRARRFVDLALEKIGQLVGELLAGDWLVSSSVQCLPQQEPGAVQLRLGGSRRHAEHFGDLFVFEAFYVVKDEYAARARRKLGDGLFEIEHVAGRERTFQPRRAARPSHPIPRRSPRIATAVVLRSSAR